MKTYPAEGTVSTLMSSVACSRILRVKAKTLRLGIRRGYHHAEHAGQRDFRLAPFEVYMHYRRKAAPL